MKQRPELKVPTTGPGQRRETTTGVTDKKISSRVTAERAERIFVAVGDVVADKYRVESFLGEGGMGFVVAARHLQLDERVALKFLHREFLDQEIIVERFAREAKAACRMKSDHVARVYDVGSWNGAPYLVMEHLVGRDLCTLVFERGPLPVEEAVEYVMQACEALAFAHAQGIVHRDIKPENLFLVESDGIDSIKVLDFGISKIALAADAKSAAESRLTGALTLGTPLYMSPEQIRSSRSVDPRSDIWSLGVVLHELLTASPPFKGDSPMELCASVLEDVPPPVDALRADLPLGLGEVVARCLVKNPDERYQNVAELAVALLRYAPKRARVFAERTSSVVLAAGPRLSASLPALQIPSTIPPASLERGSGWMPIVSRPSSLPRLPAPPAFEATRRSPLPRVQAPQRRPVAADRSRDTLITRPAKRSKAWLVGVLLAVGVAGAAVYSLLGPGAPLLPFGSAAGRGASPVALTSPLPPAASPAVAEPTSAAAPAVPTADTVASSAAAPTAARAMHPVDRRAHPPVHAVAPAKASEEPAPAPPAVAVPASPPTAPAATSDRPDLGY